MPRLGRRRLLAQAAAFLVPAAAVILAFGRSPDTTPHCGGAEVKPAIVGLFKRQLGLTPYARFIDVARANVKIEAVFPVSGSEPAAASTSCVAFATYHASLNEAGRQVPGRDHLQHSLLDELSGEKQVFYTVKPSTEGRPTIHVTRISG